MGKQVPLDAITIGGGFYGCELALFLKNYFRNILIIEKEGDLFSRASYANQARVHNGYHYPRSFMTALRSRLNFQKFIKDYKIAIDDSFEQIYAIAKRNSKANARQFVKFCEQIEAPIEPASKEIKSLFNPDLIEDAFRVVEVAFDAVKLRDHTRGRLKKEGVNVLFGTEAISVSERSGGKLEVRTNNGGPLSTKYVFNCTYSQINTLLKNSNLPLLPFKHEVTEIALMEVPEKLKNLGITVMDGPFFSIMPFPAEGLHSLSHVRYTPHHSWSDLEEYRDAHSHLSKSRIQSNYLFMVKDAQRYIPTLSQTKYVRSIYEVKTVLAKHEVDDGRPILYRKDYGGLKNFYAIMGGKIDNIYDILEVLKQDLSKG